MAKEMEKLLTKRDPFYGGVAALISGTPGCGKTNAEAVIALEDLKAKKIVVWRDKETCTWSALLNKTDKLTLWVKRGIKYEITDRKAEKKIDITKVVKVKEWSRFDALVRDLDRDRINIIVTTPHSVTRAAQHRKFIREWVSIFDAMCRRPYAQDITVIFDEMEDLLPQNAFTNLVKQATDMLKELRKNGISLFGSSHKTTEIFWVALNKIPWNIYMKNAMPAKRSKLFPSMTKKLKQGEAYIEGERFDDPPMKFAFVGQEKYYRATIRLSRKDEEALDAEEQRLEDLKLQAMAEKEVTTERRSDKETKEEGPSAEPSHPEE